jgi:hypothetical protein
MTKPMRTRSDEGTGAVIGTDRSHHIELDKADGQPSDVVSGNRPGVRDGRRPIDERMHRIQWIRSSTVFDGRDR